VRPALQIESPDPWQQTLPAPLALSTNGVDLVKLAVEVTRIVPASGNLSVCRQQFSSGWGRTHPTQSAPGFRCVTRCRVLVELTGDGIAR
jgi:hypothetical protein